MSDSDLCDCGHPMAMHRDPPTEWGSSCHFLASGKSSPARRCACKAPTTTGVPRDETFKPKRGGK